MNNFFKSAFLIVGICIVVLLFLIYQKLDNGRFKVLAGDGVTRVIDTELGRVYFQDLQGWYYYKDAEKIYVKDLTFK
jgi:hypothetical protein